MIEKRIVITFFDVTLFIIIYIVLALVSEILISRNVSIYLIAKDF